MCNGKYKIKHTRKYKYKDTSILYGSEFFISTPRSSIIMLVLLFFLFSQYILEARKSFTNYSYKEYNKNTKKNVIDTMEINKTLQKKIFLFMISNSSIDFCLFL